VVLDLTGTIVALVGEDGLTSLNTIYAFHPEEGGNVTIYVGYRDFFVGRERAVSEIRYSTTQETTCFRSSRAGDTGLVCGGIEDAPLGIVELQDLPRDEITSIEVNLDALYVSTRMDLIRIVRIRTGYGPGPLLIDWFGSQGIR
jgi:hypothetical protein